MSGFQEGNARAEVVRDLGVHVADPDKPGKVHRGGGRRSERLRRGGRSGSGGGGVGPGGAVSVGAGGGGLGGAVGGLLRALLRLRADDDPRRQRGDEVLSGFMGKARAGSAGNLTATLAAAAVANSQGRARSRPKPARCVARLGEALHRLLLHGRGVLRGHVGQRRPGVRLCDEPPRLALARRAGGRGDGVLVRVGVPPALAAGGGGGRRVGPLGGRGPAGWGREQRGVSTTRRSSVRTQGARAGAGGKRHPAPRGTRVFLSAAQRV